MNTATINRSQRRLILAAMLGMFSWPLPAVKTQAGTAPAERPNILWIIAEDASPHIGCYGETTIATPHLDRLAAEGIRFERAFVTNPVCSPSRSAMVTGMYQTTLGSHNHRSQRRQGKGGGNRAYYDSYVLTVRSVPELFRRAGYHVTNAGKGKQDYNFIPPADLYDKGDWSDRPDKSQPFFCQVQLQGGKARGANVANPVDPADVSLPPYYPNHPVLREDWARYLNSWIKTDNEVGDLVKRLRAAGDLKKTVLFFWTDHGISHLRGKQFLYDEGIRVPLIVRFGDGRRAGKVREDLVEHIDIAATSLALAGIQIPDPTQGRNIFAADYRPRRHAFAARDRCDETVEIIRAVRSGRYKYIRNFLSWLPHAQPNQYKDGKTIIKTMRRLHAGGKLNELQARPFIAPRPAEELYDLQADPHETVNLADDPKHRERLATMRQTLYTWMSETRDPGLIPEPILEDLGRKHGSKLAAMKVAETRQLIPALIALFDAGEAEDRDTLRKGLSAKRASVRYWSATWLGLLGDRSAIDRLQERMADKVPSVRMAAALALCRMGQCRTATPLLADHIDNENLLVGMYAIRALEQIGPHARGQLPAIKAARQSPYEFTRRYARRLVGNLTEHDGR